MDFTSDQKSAISHVQGNLQLIACAGSGKTEVVARRVVTLLSPTTAKGGGCRPENIVAFTFTDKAAAELKERIHARCREAFGDIKGLAEMYVGTIHGLCLDLLQRKLVEPGGEFGVGRKDTAQPHERAYDQKAGLPRPCRAQHVRQHEASVLGESVRKGGRTFHNDRPPDLKADFILANPPFNISDWGGERLRDDKRWQYGAPPAGNANFAWVRER